MRAIGCQMIPKKFRDYNVQIDAKLTVETTKTRLNRFHFKNGLNLSKQRLEETKGQKTV